MRLLNFFSLALFVGIMLFMSSANEDAGEPDCDGSLTGMVELTTNQTSCTLPDGSITITPSGGVSPYKYSLNGGAKQTSATFTGLSKGLYSVTVYDKNNCEFVLDNIEINFPTLALDFTFILTEDTDCGSSNGEIEIAASGSTGYSYSKDNGLTFQVNAGFTGLAPGTYSVVVKDVNECKVTKPVVVAQGNTGTTYTNHIKTIIDTNCATNSNCHGSGASGRPVFLTYTTVKDNATAIFSQVNSGNMPRNASKLPQAQIDLIKCWINDGRPQ